MVCLDLLDSKKIILILVLCIQQSTSKTKRSRKGPVQHVTRRENVSVTPTIINDVEDLTRIIGLEPDVDLIPRIIDSCPPLCVSCDPVNGCTRCRSRTFLHLNQTGRRQTGNCLHVCPKGHYGSRGKDTNLCKKCQVPNCASCFTSKYCVGCQEGYLLHDTKCVKVCPNGFAPDEDRNECKEKVDCEVSAWSPWSRCARKSPSKSCKYGRKKRTRVVVKKPTANGKQCPKLKEGKRCRTPDNKCPLINKWLQRQLKRQNRRKNRKGRRGKGRRSRKEIRSNDTKRTTDQNET